MSSLSAAAPSRFSDFPRFSSSPPPNRPISPHVSIYAFPLPALTSIANRVTGSALTVGFYSMGLVSLFGSCDIPAYVEAFQHAAPALVPVTKFLVGFPFVYHILAGARHLHWDRTAKNLDLPAVEASSKALVAATAVGTIVLAAVKL